MEREDHLFEELCKKGKAYRAKRMAAGEKSSAYLSGRAVKVCKGQMKSEGEEYSEIEQGWDGLSFDEQRDIINTALYGEARPDDFEKDFDQLKSELGFEFESAIADYVGIKPPEVYEEIDALHENEEYCPKCAAKIKEAIREEIEKVAKEDYKPSLRGYNVIDKSNNDEIVAKELSYDRALEKAHTNPNYKIKATQRLAKEAKTKPAKGKRFAKKVKNPKTGRTRTVSYGQAGKAKKGGDRIRPGTAKGNAYCARSAKIKKCKNPPCANTLSRKKWKCQGSRSVK